MLIDIDRSNPVGSEYSYLDDSSLSWFNSTDNTFLEDLPSSLLGGPNESLANSDR